MLYAVDYVAVLTGQNSSKMNSILTDIPSIPKIPSTTPLNIGITTRVMAKRQEMQRQLNQENEWIDDAERRRRSSKFLNGARVPNSVIRYDAFEMKVTEDAARDSDFVDKLIKRLQPKSSLSGKYSVNTSKASSNASRRELYKRYMQPILKDSARESRQRRSVSISAPNQSLDESSNSNDRWQELKDKRRITRRTSILAPLNGEKVSTYESIKKAIENSKVMQQLLNVDHMEEEKMKEIHTAKSLQKSTISREDVENRIFKNIQIKTKADIETNTVENHTVKEKAVNKRRPATKSDRSTRLTPKKSVVRQKTLVDKKHSK